MLNEIVSRLEHIPPALLKRLLAGVLWEGTPESGSFALTFDDGPDPDVTPRVLDVLDNTGAKASFFLSGTNAVKEPALVRRIAESGHVIGNHGMNHKSLFLAKADELVREIDDAGKAIADAAGFMPRWFRPPYGLFDLSCLKAVRERDLIMTLWTVLAGDYSDDSGEEVLERIDPFIRPGAIIVFHDTVKGGGAALDGMLNTVVSTAEERGILPGSLESLTLSSSIEVHDADN